MRRLNRVQRLRHGEIEIHFLMLAVAFGAALVGAWSEGALLLFLFSASGAMEHFAGARTQREIGALLRGAPKTATVLEDGQEVERPVEALAPGMRVRVRAGEQVPVDLRVTGGESACDESNLTGESRPMPKQPGDVALAGTINTWGVLDGEVLRAAHESALQKIVNLIEQAQHLKAPSQRFSDRFGTGYTYFVLGASVAFFFVGWLVVRMAALLRQCRTRQRFLSRHDFARRHVAVRARSERAVGHSFRDCFRRTARRAVPRRRGDRDTRRYQDRRPR